jgi:flagellar basal body-associated protein FliL
MKQNKGVIGVGLVLAIVLGIVVVGGGAYYLGNSNGKKEVINPVVNVEESLPAEEEEKTNTAPAVVSENSATNISTENLKTYTNSEYGFSFNYPSSWKLTEDKLKKEVIVDTNDIASGTSGDYSYPSWSITFKLTDKSFFNNNRVSTKMGIITYDENLKALVSDSCLKAEQFFGSRPTNINNTSSIQSIRYGGSMMSSPAYSNSAILTSNGGIIIVDSKQGIPWNSEIENQLLMIANSFKLLNGNTVFVPDCAK